MASYLDTASAILNDAYVVKLKTNIGPEIVVYDSRTPGDKQYDSLFEYGVTLESTNGVELANYGGEPRTNLWLASLIWGSVVFTGVALIRGIVK